METRLVLVLLALEIGVIFVIVALKGLASHDEQRTAGIVFRVVLGGAFGALAPRAAWRWLPSDGTRKSVTTAGLVIGAVVGALSGTRGAVVFGNIRDWLAASSSLTLVGGAAGLAKALTLWLALIGASLAAARGKHIGVDIGVRMMPERARMPSVTAAWVVSALVCFAASAGFVDYIAAEFRVDEGLCAKRLDSDAVSARAGEIGCIARRDVFLLGRQLSLDAMTFPSVVRGEPFDRALSEEQWNRWLRSTSWEPHFTSERVATLELHTGDATLRKMPLLAIPGGENPQELLLRELRLIVPMGFAMIGLRLLLRAILAWLGLASVDPNVAHADEREGMGREGAPHEPAPPEGGAS